MNFEQQPFMITEKQCRVSFNFQVTFDNSIDLIPNV